MPLHRFYFIWAYVTLWIGSLLRHRHHHRHCRNFHHLNTALFSQGLQPVRFFVRFLLTASFFRL